MLLFRVVVAVLAAVPLGLVENLRQEQRRLERIESFAFVKNLEIGHRPAAVEIRQDLPGARFGDDACTQRVPGAIGTDNLDLGKLLAKLVEQLFAAVTPDIKIQPSFLLGGGDRILPSYLPSWVSRPQGERIRRNIRNPINDIETVKMRPRPFRYDE